MTRLCRSTKIKQEPFLRVLLFLGVLLLRGVALCSCNKLTRCRLRVMVHSGGPNAPFGYNSIYLHPVKQCLDKLL